MFPAFYNRTYRKYYQETNDRYLCGETVVDNVNGIPRFVKSGSYASLFGEQWKAYRKTQLDSCSGSPISAKRLNRCLGDQQDELGGKLVLEAGCGAGRFTEILLQKGAFLVSADISSAVEVNKENFPVTDTHIVIQADINDMPYADESFDLVICLGVIQHTPNPEQTIKNLFGLVKKGGTMVIDHYTYDRSRFFRVAPLYRMYLKRKTSTFTIPFTRKLVDFYLPLHKKLSTNKLASILLNRISPVVSYYTAFPELNDEQQREWALLDTHDSLTDWHKHYRSRKEIFRLLNTLGATSIWCEYGGNGVEARCKK
jgi:2-polyprenyl-3-methyl-5-hydroxy-6-metoxy-1,4-benzoquinol methylase